MDGLYGALVVHDPKEEYGGEYEEEAIIIIGDWYHHIAFNLLATFMSSRNPQGEEPTPTSGIIMINYY